MTFPVTCYRWSATGFEPQIQTYLKKEYDYVLKEREELLSKTPKHLVEHVKNNILDYDPDFNFKGVFAFIQKPERRDYLFYLNHLKPENRPDFDNDLHIQSFDPNTVVYVDNGFPNRKRNKMTLSEAFDKKHLTVFIPF